MGGNVHREVLSDTAELIDNRIRMTNVGLYISQPLTERVGVYAGYNYKDFSDGNHANDIQLASQYAIFSIRASTSATAFAFSTFTSKAAAGFSIPATTSLIAFLLPIG